MHELALEGIFTQMLYLHLRNADGEILSKFNVSYQSGLSKLMRDINVVPSNCHNSPSVCLKVLDTIQ